MIVTDSYVCAGDVYILGDCDVNSVSVGTITGSTHSHIVSVDLNALFESDLNLLCVYYAHVSHFQPLTSLKS